MIVQGRPMASQGTAMVVVRVRRCVHGPPCGGTPAAQYCTTSGSAGCARARRPPSPPCSSGGWRCCSCGMYSCTSGGWRGWVWARRLRRERRPRRAGAATARRGLRRLRRAMGRGESWWTSWLKRWKTWQTHRYVLCMYVCMCTFGCGHTTCRLPINAAQLMHLAGNAGHSLVMPAPARLLYLLQSCVVRPGWSCLRVLAVLAGSRQRRRR